MSPDGPIDVTTRVAGGRGVITGGGGGVITLE